MVVVGPSKAQSLQRYGSGVVSGMVLAVCRELRYLMMAWSCDGFERYCGVMGESSLVPYGAILVVIGIAVSMGVGALLIAHLVRPARKGDVKDSTYESGMPTIGDARQRFNVRFYLIALLFLLFDVEVVFLWPWALAFFKASKTGEPIVTTGGFSAGSGTLLGAMAVFVAFLLVGFAYEWRKGALEWD